MTTPMILYCKQADLILTSSSGRRTHKPNSTLYFSPTRNYTLPEVKNEILVKKDEILKKLDEIYKGKVVITKMEDSVKQITVVKVEGGLVYYNSGVTPIAAIIEI